MSRILAIDDDRSILHIIRSQFEGTDTSVETADTAERGLTLVNLFQPDVVLLDISLPDGSGLELLQRNSKQTHQTNLPGEARYGSRI